MGNIIPIILVIPFLSLIFAANLVLIIKINKKKEWKRSMLTLGATTNP